MSAMFMLQQGVPNHTAQNAPHSPRQAIAAMQQLVPDTACKDECGPQARTPPDDVSRTGCRSRQVPNEKCNRRNHHPCAEDWQPIEQRCISLAPHWRLTRCLTEQRPE